MSARYKTAGSVTLTEEQILALHQKLREMRHDVNGQLTNIIACAELIRLRPESTEERLKTLLEQPQKIARLMDAFSRDFEQHLRLQRA
jgi:uncharacterized membrane protein